VSLTEKADAIDKVMRKTKEDWVATGPEITDLAIYLHFYRSDDMVAMVQTQLDRDTALQAGRLGAMGFAADAMSITFESYHSNLQYSPLTGEEWRHQEMQFVYETHPEAIEKGWVTECLTTTVHERGGGFVLLSASYQIKDGKVEWGEVAAHRQDDGAGEGTMFDYLRDAINAPSMDEVIAEQAKTNPIADLMNNLVSDPEARRFHIDLATLRALEEKKLTTAVILYAEPGSNRAQWLQERLGSSGSATTG
jgi:hypothetical protein